MDTFNDGFTELSYLNICKKITEGIYENAIHSPSNKNPNYQTKGLKFNFVNESSVNAMARITGEYDEIFINTGTVTEIIAWIFSAFSNPAMYSFIGKTSSENNMEVLAKYDHPTKAIHLTGTPKDKTRYSVAFSTALLGIRFICMHELGHLLNGHAYLIKDLYGVDCIDMVLKEKLYSIGLSNEYALDRRTMEMDADAFAISSGISNLDGLINDNSDGFLNALFHPLQIYELWTFAVHSIFLMWERLYPTSYDSRSFYLPNLARQRLNISAAKSTIDSLMQKGYIKYDALERQSIFLYMESGVKQAEHFFNINKSTKFNYVHDFEQDKVYQKYADEVLTHWNKNLRKRLEKYSRAVLFNPNGMDF